MLCEAVCCHHLLHACADQQIILDDLDDPDDDDDEPMIVKVESAREREQAMAAKAQQEIGRLQREQLQAKFDRAVHRKAQVYFVSHCMIWGIE